MLPVNLIFDGNYLFHKTRHIVAQYATNKRFLDNVNEQEIFIRKVATDFVSTINNFDNFRTVIFTKDSKSWRKREFDTYKATRIKDDSINWEIFYKLMDEFMEIIAEHGVITTTINDAEGDDVMYLWSKYSLDNKKYNTVIVTADADLTQVVDFNDDVFTIIYNNNSKTNKLVVPLGFTEWAKTSSSKTSHSIFNLSTSTQVTTDSVSVLQKLIDTIEVEEIDPRKVVISKILCGDSSDNVESVYSWINKNNNPQRITNKYVQPITDYLYNRFDNFSIIDLLNDEFTQKMLRKKLEELTKISIDKTIFEKNLKRNIRLVYLNENVIPESIQQNFYENVEQLTIPKTKRFDRITLLKDTRFEKNIEIYSDIFDI